MAKINHCACVAVHHMSAMPEEARRGSQIPGTGLTDCCEPESGLLQEQQLPLDIPAAPFCVFL